MQEKRRQYSAGLKLKCIAEREAGKTYVQIAAAHNVHYTTVMKWCKQASNPPALSRYRLAGQARTKYLKAATMAGKKLSSLRRTLCRARSMSRT